MIPRDRAPIWFKDPDVTKDYVLDWTAKYLPSGVTVAAATFTIPAGLTKISQSFTTSQSRVIISGGEDGQDYKCVGDATFSNGLSEEITFWIKVRNQ